MYMKFMSIQILIIIIIWGGMEHIYAQPQILSTFPDQNELNITSDINISVIFDMDMDPTTINDTTFVVYSKLSGFKQGTIIYNNSHPLPSIPCSLLSAPV